MHSQSCVSVCELNIHYHLIFNKYIRGFSKVVFAYGRSSLSAFIDYANIKVIFPAVTLPFLCQKCFLTLNNPFRSYSKFTLGGLFLSNYHMFLLAVMVAKNLAFFPLTLIDILNKTHLILHGRLYEYFSSFYLNLALIQKKNCVFSREMMVLYEFFFSFGFLRKCSA